MGKGAKACILYGMEQKLIVVVISFELISYSVSGDDDGWIIYIAEAEVAALPRADEL